MNLRTKALLAAALLLAPLALASGCKQEETPYVINDAEGYNVSVKYDANGGTFTTNTSVIVDSYNISDIKSASGKAEIALLSPDDNRRGTDAFSAVKNECFLAGWYTERTETGKDADGAPIYSYSGKWDFSKDKLTVDETKEYSAEEPAITLYAAWIPLFRVEFYNIGNEELIGDYVFNPTVDSDIAIPAWNTETGSVDMHKFPENDGYTFEAVYYDAAGKDKIDATTIAHTGSVDEATGTALNPVMKLYVEWKEGNWYRIYNADQLVKNASVAGNYELCADLDFTDKIWPSSFVAGSFNGKIIGGGHKISNVNAVQTNNSKAFGGLFGQLTEKAEITDVTFENVTFTIKAGTRVAGTNYGLFAGSVASEADLQNVQIVNGTLAIDSNCYFGTEDYTIGLISGIGDAGLDYSDIKCVAVGDNPQQVSITVNGNDVEVKFVTE